MSISGRAGKRRLSAAWALAACFCGAGPAAADLVTFDSRSVWEAAVAGSIFTEDFRGPAPGEDPAAAVYSTGITLSPAGVSGFVDITPMRTVRVTNSTMTITFPTDQVTAFGFEYRDVESFEQAFVSFGTFEAELAETGGGLNFGFFGVIADSPDQIGGSFGYRATVISEFSHVSFFIPEPAGNHLAACALAALVGLAACCHAPGKSATRGDARKRWPGDLGWSGRGTFPTAAQGPAQELHC